LDKQYGVRSFTPTKGVGGPLDDEDVPSTIEGNRLLTGTTCGDLLVWTVKNVFAAVIYTNGGDVPNQCERTIFHHGGEGVSGFVGCRKTSHHFGAASSLTRLKFPLRGRTLSRHNGDVTCIGVPSNVYRPDSLVSGGVDGLIKLWSLGALGAIAGRRNELDKGTSQMLTLKAGDSSPRSKTARNEALKYLIGARWTSSLREEGLTWGSFVDRTVRVWKFLDTQLESDGADHKMSGTIPFVCERWLENIRI
jgi:hypothetical protein